MTITTLEALFLRDKYVQAYKLVQQIEESGDWATLKDAKQNLKKAKSAFESFLEEHT